jgi:hypothetical protein
MAESHVTDLSITLSRADQCHFVLIDGSMRTRPSPAA